MLDTGQETGTVGYVLAVSIICLAVGIWIGTKIGGILAVRRLVEFEYRTLTGRAGLRRK